MFRVIASSSFIVLFSIQPLFAQMTFATKIDFPAGNGPYSVCVGDLNGDGKPDIAVADFSSDTVSVSLNTTVTGSATPTFSDRTGFQTGSQPVSVLIIDLNGDGMPDLVVTDEAAHISIFMNTMSPGASTPAFSARTDFVTGNSPESSCFGDINGDGIPDLVTANASSNNVSVFLNTTIPGASTPTFSSRTDFTTGNYPASVSIKDVNGDGKLDLAVANFNSNSVSVLLNTTAPGASVPTFTGKTDFTIGDNPFGIAIGDFNGDGKPDLAVTRSVGANTVSVLLNTTSPGTPTPTFSSATDFSTGLSPYPVSISDLNGDGKLDLVVGNYGTTTVSVLQNTTVPGATTPAFSGKLDFSMGGSPLSVFIADLNGDFKQDIVSANLSSNTVSVLLNTTTSGAAVPAFSEITSFSLGSSPYSGCVGDFNGDGMLDLAAANLSSSDVSVLLNTTVPGATVPTFSGKTDFTAGNSSLSVANGDLNGDGRPDLAIANFNAATVSVLMNTTDPGVATPSFSTKTDFTTGANPYSVSIGDINGDGKRDLVIANYSQFDISVFINITDPGAVTPSFSAATNFASGNFPDYVAVKDLNGDGKPDIILARNNINSVSILINKTTPGSATPTFTIYTEFSTGSVSYAVSVEDLNGDGKPDLAVANYNTDNISVFLNTTAPGDTTPSFSSKTDFTTGYRPSSISIDDINGDGKPDLAVTNSGDDTVSVLLNTTAPGAATPSFSEITNFATGSSPNFISINDFNGDGKSDLAIINSGWNSISILLNEVELQTGVATGNESVPIKYELTQNYPNPFNPSTSIEFTLAEDGMADLRIYDMLGREVKTLVRQELKAGMRHVVSFDASGLSTGIYYCRLVAGRNALVRKLILIK